MIIVDISLGAISEAVIAALLILLKGNIDGDMKLYAMMSKIIFWICVRILSFLSKGKVEVTDKNFYALILTIAAGINIIWVILLLKISERSVDGDIRSGILLLVFVILFLDIIVFKLCAAGTTAPSFLLPVWTIQTQWYGRWNWAAMIS